MSLFENAPIGAHLKQEETIMTVAATPHLNLRGNAREALEFYRSAFGGEVALITYADMGNPEPATADRIVWGQVTSADGFRIMAYDVYPHLPWDQGQDPFFVSVRGTDAAQLQGYWDRLSEGATIRQPLQPSAWAPLYGQLTDRFGITWVMDIAPAYPA
jgi:PhnB protein